MSFIYVLFRYYSLLAFKACSEIWSMFTVPFFWYKIFIAIIGEKIIW